MGTETASCLLRWFFILSTATGVAAKEQEAPGKDTMYVYSTIDGCYPVQSQEPCPVDRNLPSFFARSYKGHNRIIKTSLNLMDGDAINRKCKAAATAALCSQVTPRCLQNSSFDYGNAKSLCEQVTEFCPEDVIDDVCRDIETGVHSKSECVYPSSPVEGICPQPKYKMASIVLYNYRKKSKAFTELFTNLETFPGKERLFSKECLLEMKEMFCVNLVCSADEKRLLIKHNIDDCQAIFKKCFKNTTNPTLSPFNVIINEIMEELLKAQCIVYPESNTVKTESAPPSRKRRSSATAITSSQPFITVLFFILHILY